MIGKMLGFAGELVEREIKYHRVQPTNALIFLTYRCTSHCKSCSMWKRTSEGRELSLQEWRHFIDMIAGRGIRHIEMFGGDALLRKDVLIPLIRYAKEKCACTTDLVTNCNLLDAKTARELVDAGIDIVSVSVDGVDELHDGVRGSAGTFGRVCNALTSLRQARGNNKKPKLLINCTVSALNIGGFERVRDFAAEMGVDAIAFEYAGQFSASCLARSAIEGVEPRPFYADPENRILLDLEQAKLLKKKIALLKKSRGSGPAIYTKNIDALNIEQLAQGLAPNRRCYVCRYLITVDPYGNAMPCAFYPDYRTGNIVNEGFDKVWNNDRHKKFIRRVSSADVPMCRHCIIGVERNPTPWQLVKRKFRSAMNAASRD